MSGLAVRQEFALKILSAVNDLCEKEGLRCFVIGGTLIGAIRHEGYIPWDDDIDIALPRPDYERLLSLASSLPEPFEILHQGNDSEFIHSFAKGYDYSTTAIEDKDKPFIRGVWIDIFPLDGAFENKWLRSIHFGLIRFFLRKLNDQQRSFPPASGAIKRFRKRAKEILSRVFPRAFLIAAVRKIAMFRKYEESGYVVNFFGRWGRKEVCRSSVFEDSFPRKFENLKVNVPVGYDEWLTNVYGDYMLLPSEEKRKPDHELKYLNVGLPYREALKNLKAYV